MVFTAQTPTSLWDPFQQSGGGIGGGRTGLNPSVTPPWTTGNPIDPFTGQPWDPRTDVPRLGNTGPLGGGGGQLTGGPIGDRPIIRPQEDLNQIIESQRLHPELWVYNPEQGRLVLRNGSLGLGGGGQLEGLSDNQLMDLARMFGIDTSFMGGNNITIDPEVRANVTQAYQSQRDLGNQEMLRDAIEKAGARGLNLSDTPIGDPYLRNKALFESQLRGNEAATLLGLSEGRFNTNEATRKFQGEQNRLREVQRQNFMSGLLNFQQALQQQAFQNRLALAGQGGTTTTQRSSGGSGSNAANIASGIGGVAGALKGLNLGGIFDWASGLFGGGSGGNTGPQLFDPNVFDIWDRGGF